MVCLSLLSSRQSDIVQESRAAKLKTKLITVHRGDAMTTDADKLNSKNEGKYSGVPSMQEIALQQERGGIGRKCTIPDNEKYTKPDSDRFNPDHLKK